MLLLMLVAIVLLDGAAMKLRFVEYARSPSFAHIDAPPGMKCLLIQAADQLEKDGDLSERFKQLIRDIVNRGLSNDLPLDLDDDV